MRAPTHAQRMVSFQCCRYLRWATPPPRPAGHALPGQSGGRAREGVCRVPTSGGFGFLLHRSRVSRVEAGWGGRLLASGPGRAFTKSALFNRNERVLQSLDSAQRRDICETARTHTHTHKHTPAGTVQQQRLNNSEFSHVLRDAHTRSAESFHPRARLCALRPAATPAGSRARRNTHAASLTLAGIHQRLQVRPACVRARLHPPRLAALRAGVHVLGAVRESPLTRSSHAPGAQRRNLREGETARRLPRASCRFAACPSRTRRQRTRSEGPRRWSTTTRG